MRSRGGVWVGRIDRREVSVGGLLDARGLATGISKARTVSIVGSANGVERTDPDPEQRV